MKSADTSRLPVPNPIPVVPPGGVDQQDSKRQIGESATRLGGLLPACRRSTIWSPALGGQMEKLGLYLISSRHRRGNDSTLAIRALRLHSRRGCSATGSAIGRGFVLWESRLCILP